MCEYYVSTYGRAQSINIGTWILDPGSWIRSGFFCFSSRRSQSHVTVYKVREQIIDVVSEFENRSEYDVFTGPFNINLFYEDTLIWGS